MKPWSVTTTVRNPQRVRDFLIVARELEGEPWDENTQKNYQIKLIQHRIYGYGNQLFKKNLKNSQITLLDDYSRKITFTEANDIFDTKGYEDPPMRGRQSLNVLKKFGFVSTYNKSLHITDLGSLFLEEDYDIGKVFLKCFIKWQIPNPLSDDYSIEGGYDIKPFIGVLNLIQSVNDLEELSGGKPKGLSKYEFDIFAPTLINYKDIDSYAERIISIREDMKAKPLLKQREIFNSEIHDFIGDFLGSKIEKDISSLKNTLLDYGDNALRYFRVTKFIKLRGNDRFIDLEPLRLVEINSLLKSDNAKSLDFDSEVNYEQYISDIHKPKLPWEVRSETSKIYSILLTNVRQLESETGQPECAFPLENVITDQEIVIEIEKLRAYRRQLQEYLDRQTSQSVVEVREYVEGFSNICENLSPAIELERLSTLGLNALDDAIKIKANFPVGDDNQPTSTAPGNGPDIECFYEKFNAICEVTMLRDRSQWYAEGQPVMRHLRDFENLYPEKEAYCLFIAPTIHRDTLNTYWDAVKHGYEGKQLKIIPVTIDQFSEVLKTLITIKECKNQFRHQDILDLYDRIINSTVEITNSQTWVAKIPIEIELWKKDLVKA